MGGSGAPLIRSRLKPAMSAAYTLRSAVPADSAFQLEVYASTRADELALTQWSPAQKQAFAQMQFEAQTRHYAIAYPEAETSIIELDQTRIGRLIVWRTAHLQLLMDIALLPAYRRAGIGTAILHGLMHESQQAGLPLRLHVEPFNPALHLYQRLGFEKIAESGFYYEMEWRPQEKSVYDR
jgi:ribosomal protein S18 acetylase RimI-like enzyme